MVGAEGGKLVKKLIQDFVRAARLLIVPKFGTFATWSMTCMGVWKLRKLYLLLYIIINNNKKEEDLQLLEMINNNTQQIILGCLFVNNFTQINNIMMMIYSEKRGSIKNINNKL